MRNVLFFVLCIVFVVRCASSENMSESTRHIRRHVIFLFDDIDDEVVKFFDKSCNSRLGNDIEALTQYQPLGYDEVSLSVHSSSIYTQSPIAKVIFLENEKDKSSRMARARKFINSLKEYKKKIRSNDKYVLNNLSGIISSINDEDKNSQYEIILVSNLLESSGGAIRNDKISTNGTFRFVYPKEENTDNYECNPAHFSEAQRQMQDENSWIYRHLIDNDAKGILKNVELKLSVNHKPTIYSTNNVDCDLYKDFWYPLFKKIGFKGRKEIEFQAISIL